MSNEQARHGSGSAEGHRGGIQLPCVSSVRCGRRSRLLIVERALEISFAHLGKMKVGGRRRASFVRDNFSLHSTHDLQTAESHPLQGVPCAAHFMSTKRSASELTSDKPRQKKYHRRAVWACDECRLRVRCSSLQLLRAVANCFRKSSAVAPNPASSVSLSTMTAAMMGERVLLGHQPSAFASWKTLCAP